MILPGETRWNGLWEHWTRLCVHLYNSIEQYYSNELENVGNVRKSHRGREALKQALKAEKLSENEVRAGQQMASLFKLPAQITKILQTKQTPSISIAYPLVKYF